MSMFCFQCQETARNTGCTVKGVCGKKEETAQLQDLLIYACKGISLAAEHQYDQAAGRFITQALFATITNANFDDDRLEALIREGLVIRDRLAKNCGKKCCTDDDCHDALIWEASERSGLLSKAQTVGVLSCEHEDIRSLNELVIYGLKGISAYASHAEHLGYEQEEIYRFIFKALAATLKHLDVESLKGLVLETGKTAVQTMALLDKANTETYGHPEITEVKIGAGSRPGILISGHDLEDMENLLKQTEDQGIDIYTHSEMLPANYYPAFKKYKHFYGNYGNAWWKQGEEFEKFNGAILMTTNCIVPVKESYKDRIFTTGMAGYPGVPHIIPTKDGKKDFSAVIARAKTCPPPQQIEEGTIVGGFAHHQVLALADKVVAAVKSGAIKRFVVMAGCDGRHTSRGYFTDVAQELPKDTIILTAGCAKYRYNKLQLGDIGGIPRVLDAGQCNDSYSLALIALKLQEVFGLESINELPLSFDIAWYEQKAVAVLLALLYLGVKGIRLGPTLPGFLSPNVAKVLVDLFDIKPTADAKGDVALMMSGH
jgi:hydroxylamine reductase